MSPWPSGTERPILRPPPPLHKRPARLQPSLPVVAAQILDQHPTGNPAPDRVPPPCPGRAPCGAAAGPAAAPERPGVPACGAPCGPAAPPGAGGPARRPVARRAARPWRGTRGRSWPAPGNDLPAGPLRPASALTLSEQEGCTQIHRSARCGTDRHAEHRPCVRSDTCSRLLDQNIHSGAALLGARADEAAAVACHDHGTTLKGFLPRAWDHPVASDGTTRRVVPGILITGLYGFLQVNRLGGSGDGIPGGCRD
jgi:hypothetical protein